MEPRISIVSLGVEDMARATAFYEGLGWKPSSMGGDEAAFFQLGGMALGLYGRRALAAEAGLDDPGGFGGVTLAHNVASRAAVDAVLAAAEAAGGTIVAPAVDRHWGGYSGYFADPDGHPWEVSWNPYATLTPDGRLVLPD